MNILKCLIVPILTYIQVPWSVTNFILFHPQLWSCGERNTLLFLQILP